MNNNLQTLVLSALLHDIGKFAQRAGRPYSRELESTYLTNINGRPGHWHTVYSDYFIEKDLPLQNELEGSRSLIARIASAHHRPDEKSLPEMSLMIADRLSAGIDRIEEEEQESKIGFRESRLLSVFDEVELEKHQFELPGNWFHDLAPLESGSEEIFPRSGSPKGPVQDYETLFNRFYSDLKQLNTNVPFSIYLDGLISLLEKYTWCIPSSSFKTLPDISLFDHVFSTAGIAQSLYLYHDHNGSIPHWKDDERKFVLMGGDLSGIQDYIFGISRSSGRGVSKIFRARSFYLQALTRSILLEIQNKLNLFSVCWLMNSGGKFILILPSIEPLKDQLNDLDEAVQVWFRRKFKGLLTMNLSWSTELSRRDFLLENFQLKIEEVNAALEQSKLRKLKRTFTLSGPVIEEDYNENEGGNCLLCGINEADENSSKRYEEKEGLSISICKDCCEQIVYLGTRLPKTDYLIYGDKGKIPLFGKVHLTLSEKAPPELGGIYLVETLKDASNFSRTRLARHLPLLTKEELADKKWLNLFQSEEENQNLLIEQPKTFSMIAQKSKKDLKGELVGRELLGFLKADVDNLGFLFSIGMGDRLSVARFASISRMLNFFFSDYLVHLVQKEFPDTYVVFAGGDDLFLVGPWWQTIHLAIMLRNKLSQFCANNPDFTMSAGILVAKPRLPMRRTSDLVEQNLEEAKKYLGSDRTKDSVRLLEQTLSWTELGSLLELGEKFDRAIEERERTNFSMAFMYRLLEYYRMYRRFINEKNINFGRYLSLAHYDIGRNIQGARRDNQDELEMLYQIFAVGISERTLLDNLNIPLFYAINMNRKS